MTVPGVPRDSLSENLITFRDRVVIIGNCDPSCKTPVLTVLFSNPSPVTPVFSMFVSFVTLIPVDATNVTPFT